MKKVGGTAVVTFLLFIAIQKLRNHHLKNSPATSTIPSKPTLPFKIKYNNSNQYNDETYIIDTYSNLDNNLKEKAINICKEFEYIPPLEKNEKSFDFEKMFTDKNTQSRIIYNDSQEKSEVVGLIAFDEQYEINNSSTTCALIKMIAINSNFQSKGSLSFLLKPALESIQKTKWAVFYADSYAEATRSTIALRVFFTHLLAPKEEKVFPGEKDGQEKKQQLLDLERQLSNGTKTIPGIIVHKQENMYEYRSLISSMIKNLEPDQKFHIVSNEEKNLSKPSSK